jgi:hypothetical protein
MLSAPSADVGPWWPVTVTEVTPRFGLADLVRFSVEYRKKFAERSSKTLR